MDGNYKELSIDGEALAFLEAPSYLYRATGPLNKLPWTEPLTFSAYNYLISIDQAVGHARAVGTVVAPPPLPPRAAKARTTNTGPLTILNQIKNKHRSKKNIAALQF